MTVTTIKTTSQHNTTKKCAQDTVKHRSVKPQDALLVNVVSLTVFILINPIGSKFITV